MSHTSLSLSKKTKLIIILLVLLLHLLILIPLLMTEFIFLPEPEELKQKVEQLHKKIHKIEEPKPEEWAALQSRAMQMSAPVILVDDPDIPKDENENTQDLPEDAEEQKEPDSSAPDSAHDDSIQENLEDLEKKLTKENTQYRQLIDIPIDTHAIKQKEIIKQEEKKSTQKQVKPQTQQKKQTPKITTQKNTLLQQSQQQKQQPKLSLAQLAQGFVDHMKHEGDYTISMSGSNSAKATESQLKIGRFLQRVIGPIQNAWRANVQHYPLAQPVIVSIHFTIVINKDGTLNKVGIDQSSGNTLVDNYIKHIIQDASSSFPAIPQSMGHDVCSIRCNLDNIRLPEGPPGYTIHQ